MWKLITVPAFSSFIRGSHILPHVQILSDFENKIWSTCSLFWPRNSHLDTKRLSRLKAACLIEVKLKSQCSLVQLSHCKEYDWIKYALCVSEWSTALRSFTHMQLMIQCFRMAWFIVNSPRVGLTKIDLHHYCFSNWITVITFLQKF